MVRTYFLSRAVKKEGEGNVSFGIIPPQLDFLAVILHLDPKQLGEEWFVLTYSL